MNDRGKSDSRVVPVKLANKTGQPAAELVEERRLTKGNTDQHNASRTQSRDVDASSALGTCAPSCTAGQGNAVHSAASPRHAGSSADSLLGAEPKGRCGRRRREVGCLRAEPGGQPPGSARSGPPRRLPGETIAKGVHTEGGRAASVCTPFAMVSRGRRRGGPDRADPGGWPPGPARRHPTSRLSLIHISEPTRRTPISYAVF